MSNNKPLYCGHLPSEKISQRVTPKAQTALCVVMVRSGKDSGAIHMAGIFKVRSLKVVFNVDDELSERKRSSEKASGINVISKF